MPPRTQDKSPTPAAGAAAVAEITLVVRAGAAPQAAPRRHHIRAFNFTALVEPVAARPADEADLQRVEAWLGARGLRVSQVSALQRCVVARGAAADVQRIFGSAGRIPTALAEIVTEVLGAGGAQAVIGGKIPHFRGQSVDPRQVAQYYRFPFTLQGRGQTIGLVLLSGGFHKRDLELYFRKLRLPVPTVETVAVDGQGNAPADHRFLAAFAAAMRSGKRPPFPASGRNALANVQWTWETTQGVQLAGTFANQAKIVVYFGRNDEAGRYRVLAHAIRDREHAPSVLCCSWHIGFEEQVSVAERTRLNALFEEAGRRGVTVCVASGDWGDGTAAPGAAGAPAPQRPRVCFPASSPYVLACGGSSQVLRLPAGEETVWDEIVATATLGSGGGASRCFALPKWQRAAGVPTKARRSGRGVPDVAAKANLEGGYMGILGGAEVSNGGTSAAAPLWGCVIAMLNQAMRLRLGFVNPLLYHPKIRNSLRPITFGANGPNFKASTGWNPCTGLGTPIAAALLAQLRRHGVTEAHAARAASPRRGRTKAG